MRRLGILIVSAALLCAVPVHAEVQQQNKGLFVTPVREYLGVDPGHAVTKQMTVANNTADPVSITFSTDQFSVANYTYDFTFKATQDSWITFAQPQVELLPGKSYVQTYTVTAPAEATPGGHYFTVIATASGMNGAVKNKVQAAMTVYVTVQGSLQLTTSIQHVSAPRLLFGGDFTFSLDVKDTGNTHFFVYASGELQGLSAKGKGPEATHLLMPNTVRTVSGSVPPPLLPGVYNAVFGYKTDAGQLVQRTQHVVYIPVWSLFATAGLIWIGVVLVRRTRRASLAAGYDRVGHR